ncbi:ATP-binding protein [Methanolobus psychrotolerans]|uniref:ATP-binding protein n=1 Tax=Methanolobus psychrotolerans TaxID=1874706 RepID=UPI000B919CA7|nr:ATP-binding protein [Methanolobus psychrotolerans]
MQNSLIDYSGDDLQKGFRLHRLEVFNWGTFNKRVWKIEPMGFNSLLTGDNGSGKSTLVDAITTLLVQPHKITYNKAAGAEKKERNLLSYVRGEHKNERDEYNNSKPVYLRKEEDYSVILSYFYNKGFNKGFTLAQVFWMKNGSVDRFFVTSETDLNIMEHFSLIDGETDIAYLKKRIKKIDKTNVHDSFKGYSDAFRPFFGIESDKVLELFFQTVSMKSIGKLTEFMRDHMLEETDFRKEIEAMINNYNDLTTSYELVQKAKKQINQLEPMVKDIGKYEETSQKINELQEYLNYLPFFFADRKYGLLKKAIESSTKDMDTLTGQITQKTEIIGQLRNSENETSIALHQNIEGQRIEQLKREITDLDKTKALKSKKREEYYKLCSSIGISPADDEHTFKKSIDTANQLLLQVDEDLERKQDERSKAFASREKLQSEYNIHESELKSLSQRKTKIPGKNLSIRNSILENCSLKGIELPFIGELIQVKPSEKEWEGALERLLHNFGLSILVSEDHYKTISKYVNQNDLKGRLVYFRVPASASSILTNEPGKTSVVNKLEIKADSAFHSWVKNELIDKFDFACCDSIEQFQEESKSITKNGQIKGSRGRHEKDDRTNIHDQQNYVLGWNNLEKVDSIKEQMASLYNKINECISEHDSFKKEGKIIEQRKNDIRDILKINDFDDLNWEKDVTEIEKRRQDIKDLEETSDQLRTLNEQLISIREQIQKEDGSKSKLEINKGKLEEKIDIYKEKQQKCELELKINPFKDKQELPDITKYMQTKVLEIVSIDQEQADTKERIELKQRQHGSQRTKLSQNIVAQISQYKGNYPAETNDIPTVIDSMQEFVKIYNKLKEENLPKYEENFKKELREHTIQSIATFKSKLDNEVTEINKNIRKINEFLRQLEYNPGTYIELRSDNSPDGNIREFRAELKDCLAETLGNEDVYNEERFHKVKRLLDKFKGANTADSNWTKNVTDVRKWLIFSAAENFCIDDTEKEFYSDSSGKSGGQKEKLAYTILASALAYRFGPAGDQPVSNSFRFVIIDEAFGRSSDDSTRYGLDLFKKLNLQLLIVTPLQKINVVEDYINYVHLLSNENGEYSKTRDITIEQYREDKFIQQSGMII